MVSPVHIGERILRSYRQIVSRMARCGVWAMLSLKSPRERMLMLPARTPTTSLLRMVLVLLCLAVLPCGLALAMYPERPIRIIVPFAPGGGTDVVARTLAQDMAKDLGVSGIIQNRTGGGSPTRTPAGAASDAAPC